MKLEEDIFLFWTSGECHFCFRS